MSSTRRSSSAWSLAASLTLLSFAAACTPGNPVPSSVEPAGSPAASASPAPAASATPAPASSQTPAPSESVAPAPTATPGYSGGGGSSTRYNGPVATYDVQGNQLKVRYQRPAGASEFVDSFVVAVTGIPAAASYAVAAPAPFDLLDGRMKVGTLYSFQFGSAAGAPAVLNQAGALPAEAFAADEAATAGVQLDKDVVVPAVNNGKFGGVRFSTGKASNPSWEAGEKLYLAVRYNQQQIFQPGGAGVSELAAAQTDEFTFKLPVSINRAGLNVKVLAKASTNNTAGSYLSATFDDSLLSNAI